MKRKGQNGSGYRRGSIERQSKVEQVSVVHNDDCYVCPDAGYRCECDTSCRLGRNILIFLVGRGRFICGVQYQLQMIWTLVRGWCALGRVLAPSTFLNTRRTRGMSQNLITLPVSLTNQSPHPSVAADYPMLQADTRTYAYTRWLFWNSVQANSIHLNLPPSKKKKKKQTALRPLLSRCIFFSFGQQPLAPKPKWLHCTLSPLYHNKTFLLFVLLHEIESSFAENLLHDVCR